MLQFFLVQLSRLFWSNHNTISHTVFSSKIPPPSTWFSIYLVESWKSYYLGYKFNGNKISYYLTMQFIILQSMCIFSKRNLRSIYLNMVLLFTYTLFLLAGGGFNGKKESGQLRFGGRDRPFKKPIGLLSSEEIMLNFNKIDKWFMNQFGDSPYPNKVCYNKVHCHALEKASWRYILQVNRRGAYMRKYISKRHRSN